MVHVPLLLFETLNTCGPPWETHHGPSYQTFQPRRVPSFSWKMGPVSSSRRRWRPSADSIGERRRAPCRAGTAQRWPLERVASGFRNSRQDTSGQSGHNRMSTCQKKTVDFLFNWNNILFAGTLILRWNGCHVNIISKKWKRSQDIHSTRTQRAPRSWNIQRSTITKKKQ